MPIVAWYMLSNESYMKRVMSEVFPTTRWKSWLVSVFPKALYKIVAGRTYHSARQETPACTHARVSNPHSPTRATSATEGTSAYLNFFKGLLYEPPAPPPAWAIIADFVGIGGRIR